MKAIEIITGILSILVVMPIWYYLLYQIILGILTSCADDLDPG